jgi:NitT/TauT family transport system substrate-binding protein
MTTKLGETFRALFYTPFYLPFSLGTYESEGLDIELSSSPTLASITDHFADGAPEVFWGGPMRIMLMRDQQQPQQIVGFCEAITRDPFFLIGRTPNHDYKHTDLANVTFATVSEVPTPWLCLQEDLRQAGMDPDAITRITTNTMGENVAALQAGEVDVVQLFQPFAEELLEVETCHLWHAQASRGYTSYTTLYALEETIQQKPDLLHKMTRAQYRAQKWLHAHSPAEVTDAVADYFPDVPRERFMAAVKRYLDLGVWGKTPHLPREGFESLRAGLISGGFIDSSPAFADCVDNQFADAVIAEDPAAP